MDNEQQIELYNIWMINIGGYVSDDLGNDFDENGEAR